MPFSYGGTIDPLTPDSKYIDFGKEFYCIHELYGTYEDNTNFCGSAVVIDDHHILTAAHLVKGSKSCYLLVNGVKYNLSDIIIHKDFESKQFGKGDIALCFSSVAFDFKSYPPIYKENSEIGKVCSISGYGLTGTFHTGARTYDGKRRAGSNTIDRIYEDLLICTPSYRNSKGYTSLEFMIASGDSGGGLFIDGKLAGINSCIMVEGRSPSAKYGEESGYTRVSKFIGWINEHKTKMD